jgi:5-methylcytosine-specific restriction protein A
MPLDTKKPCYHPGCKNLTFDTYCEKHEKSRTRFYNRKLRKHAELYDYQWYKAAKLFLSKNPLCVECEKKYGEIKPATEVDHIIPHKGNYKLFWNHKNWQPLCKTCHSQKTNRERNE